MSGGEKEDMGFLHVNEGILNHATSEINTNQMSEKISGTAVNNYFASSWDPIASLSQSDNFGVSTMVSHGDFSNSLYPTEVENQGMSSSSCIQYPAASSYANLTPKGHCYGSGNCSEMVGSYGIPEHGKITATGYSSNHIPNIQNSGDRAPGNDSNPQNVFGTREERVAGASPDGKKRKRAPDLDSPRKSKKNAEEGLQKNVSEESSDGAKQATSIPKSGQNSDKNVNNKQTGKQAAESSHSGEASKDSYIHVRARRGQATNSHSLAERLRREKISERMRLLQDLVPGCNKITGKAVMLDEIINYVQSLQQQVEFLSMKLATVNPELNFDIDRILSKDVSQGCSPAVLGLGPGMSAASHPYQLGNLHGNFQAIPHIPQFTPLPHAVLDNDFQSLLQMGFNASSSMENLGPNGRFKPEM